MHSDHRRRYHRPAPAEPVRYEVVPAADIYPGHRVSTDPVAIAAASGEGNPDVHVDWPAVEAASRVVRDRLRPTPTELRFATASGGIRADTYAELLLIRTDVPR